MDYFQTGFFVDIMIENPDIDYSTIESQYTMLDFYDKLERAYLGTRDWFVPYSLNLWYMDFLRYFVEPGYCTHLPDGLIGF